VLFVWRLGVMFILCCLLGDLELEQSLFCVIHLDFGELEQCLFCVAYLEAWTWSNVYAPSL